MEREKINVSDYAQTILEALPRGILLNTRGEKFNAMVIGWGHLGVIWGAPTFAVYVREGRYTKAVLDQTGEFTLSVPLGKPDAQINRVCGSLSGRSVDKAREAGLTLVPARQVKTPAVLEYPLTLECRVLYAQKQALEALPEGIRTVMYPQNVDGTHPMANRDAHTAYIGQIVDAYILRAGADEEAKNT